MADFTPGPWAYRPQEYDDWGVVRGPADGEGRQWLVANARAGGPSRQSDDEHRRNGTDPYEANARLIAAAPALYEALDEIRAIIRNEPFLQADDELWAAFEKACRVLREARGDSLTPEEGLK